jgi:BASS family bile acid:Na+ symporter
MAMFSLMFGMGLTLVVGDFRRIARNPTATIVGTLLQLVGMPLVGIGLALAFDLPLLLAAGLVVVAACPGGMFSNMYIHLARANTPLSITLTASATMVTLLTLPLWTRWILSLVGGEASGIEMPVLETAVELGTLTVLPVFLGMVARSWRPQLVWLEKWLARGGALLIIGAVTYDSLQRDELPLAEAELSFAPAFLLALAAVAMGLVVPALSRLSMRDSVTIAVELVVKNSLLGIVLASRSLEFEAVIPIFMFSIAQTPAGILVLVAWRLLARYGFIEPLPESSEAPSP